MIVHDDAHFWLRDNTPLNHKKQIIMSTSKLRVKRVCDWCGKEFLSQKTTTRYCSKRCAELAYKDRVRQKRKSDAEAEIRIRTKEEPLQKIRDNPYLRVRETAILLNVSVRTVYNLIYAGKLKASKISSRLTIISKDDVDAMLSSMDYRKTSLPASLPITDFYTTKEIMDRYDVSESWVYEVGKDKAIPKVFQRGRTYWSKKHVDKAFKKEDTYKSITEWYSVCDIKSKFKLSTDAVYRLASEYMVPRKKINREVVYSKRHIDIAMGIATPESLEYYTMPEAMEKYHMTRDQIYHYVRSRKIFKVQVGKYVKISKKELDQALAPPIIAPVK